MGNPAIVQSKAASSQTSEVTSLTITLTSAPTVGNTLFCMYSEVAPPGFTVWTSETDSTTGGTIYIATRTVQSGDGTSWTMTYGGSGIWLIGVIYEISNYGGIDQVAYYSSGPSNSPYTAPSITPSKSNTVAIACGGCNNGSGGPFTPTLETSGWTQQCGQSTLNCKYDTVFSASYNSAPTSGSALTGPTFGNASNGGGGYLITFNIYGTTALEPVWNYNMSPAVRRAGFYFMEPEYDESSRLYLPWGRRRLSLAR